ncbi:transcription factor SPT20 homolog [Camellia sinensis]|uniref:transcription factor SPT20 homolog n=1 Tax=Camellia sinensis TaxID=4442 RepID=UPI00103658F7|nr:transcription factor SPT20 homolog [Camellia sinensis]
MRMTFSKKNIIQNQNHNQNKKNNPIRLSRKQKSQEEPESDEQEEESDEEKKQVTDEEEAEEEETEEEEPDEQQDNDEAEERQEAKCDQPKDTDEEEQQQQTNQQQEVNEQELTNQQEELQEKSDIFHAQGHDQAQTPTKEDDKDKLISAMRAQMQDIEQKFMAELRKKEDQLKEMSTKKTGSPQQRSMVIDAFSEKQLALQLTIEEFEKNDLAFARNPYAGRSYVFSTLINQQHQLRWNKALLSNQGNMSSSQECETVIASIEECLQQTPHSNDCAIAVCNIINQYINWQPVQKSLRPTEWVKFRAEIVSQFLNDEIRSWKVEHYQITLYTFGNDLLLVIMMKMIVVIDVIIALLLVIIIVLFHQVVSNNS